jgi:hypothetical protein
VIAACGPAAAACQQGTATAAQGGAAPVPRAVASAGAAAAADSGAGTLVPVGYGTLRQDEIAVRVQLVGGLTVRAIPLEESVIRVLSPDSYRTLADLLASRRPQLAEIARRFNLPRYSVWYVTFFGAEQGEARFSPTEFIVTTAGRDFRPLEVIPLTPGFGEYRLRQRETQSALLVFDGQLDVNQPLSVTVETTRDDSWGGAVLPRVERERALVRSRSTRTPRTP